MASLAFRPYFSRRASLPWAWMSVRSQILACVNRGQVVRGPQFVGVSRSVLTIAN